MAYRDARAWRRVALDFAKINAMAASRVQNLVAASLREGKAGGEIGRQIERELEEATRAVAQRRNFIQEQDRKDAEAAASGSSQRSFGDAWADVLDPFHGTGFFFGSREGRRGSDLGEYGRWKPSKVTRHDDISSASTDGLAFKASEPWSRCKASDSAPNTRTAQLKWQRVVGPSCAAPPGTVTGTAVGKSATAASSAKDADAQTEAREDWIGDVDLAIRERDRKSSLSAGASDQAAVDAFSRLESEVAIDAEQSVLTEHKTGYKTVRDNEEDHLLPVSDLYIATNGQIRETPEEPIKRSMAISKLKRTRIGSMPTKKLATDADKYSYPISDEFKDLHDIFIAAWDDNFAGLSTGAATETCPTLKSDDPTQGGKAKPNRALFEQLRSQRAQKGNVKADAKSSSEADEIEFMAELMFPSAAPKESTASNKPNLVETAPTPVFEKHEPAKHLDEMEAELASFKLKANDLSERLETMREMCHDLTDEAWRREKTHRIQVEQLDHKIGLFTVWAEEVQRRLGLETPPFFASLRKPLKKE
ncbi:hypothetical protein PSEUBRA_004211 [Kalmanozyma brasiliensis GHG001]|uniref:Uncharacterized protein n=1 Tax=Kalmanozyma brasiliensis (strain GHG001) TaxID=1365824 RepID=V5EVP2_KALBG|nr:uncharacterized protein PSEUBRA_004211 [Kalmanozyma brasiliensis GHG001]EST06324.1 hypothetical protein PSEUBRA_004211 [Kalmanozyma brasiliensis GHG001]